ncbi:PH domain-containing protein [Wenyingzhuangia sp. chi5]|uniref:PH domain-containing protein n=1 Tax=Wenyingzhuangia gilva TaxID=3057677 RepID=A0ABT8VUP0_9FLAO|nr:PH domain-containing protein [Wenyingzhuangia sp. chi5]MDO3695681.1 PH domain-containing protein [Wenyingzhuangia sp. chi5]
MRFKSRKDLFFPVFVFGISLLFIGLSISKRIEKDIRLNSFLWSDLILLSVIIFIIWLHYSTYYELSKTQLKYKSGFLKGTIEIENIREIIKNKTLWVGIKPATATKGLIIKYNKYDEIYISPKTNDTFIQEILTLNKNIKITEA